MAISEVLPPEIVLQIVRLATEDPGSSLELERLRLGPNDKGNSWFESNSYRETLATKVSSSKTCRQWNAIVHPFLYEHVSVTTIYQYKKVLKRFSVGGSVNEVNRLVTRLDLACPAKDRALAIAVELCKLFPALETCILSLGGDDDDDPLLLFHALSSTSSLQHLFVLPENWGARGLVVPFSCIVDFLDLHPRLAAFSIPYSIRPPNANNVKVIWAKKRWPKLQSLVFQHDSQAQSVLSFLPSHAFPELRNVNTSYSEAQRYDRLSAFLAPQWHPKLATLSFFIDQWEDMLPLANFLRTLASYPRVLEVHLWSCSSDMSSSKFKFTPSSSQVTQIPPVSVVGVHLPVAKQRYHSNEWMSSFHVLAAFPWMRAFPKFRTIRVMDKIDVTAYRKYDSVTRERLASPGRYIKHPIRVEDQEGQLLAEFSSGIAALVER